MLLYFLVLALSGFIQSTDFAAQTQPFFAHHTKRVFLTPRSW